MKKKGNNIHELRAAVAIFGNKIRAVILFVGLWTQLCLCFCFFSFVSLLSTLEYFPLLLFFAHFNSQCVELFINKKTIEKKKNGGYGVDLSHLNIAPSLRKTKNQM